MNILVDFSRESISDITDFAPYAVGEYVQAHMPPQPVELDFDMDIPRQTFAEWQELGL
jgi:hypothetical protein